MNFARNLRDKKVHEEEQKESARKQLEMKDKFAQELAQGNAKSFKKTAGDRQAITVPKKSTGNPGE